MKKLPIKVLVVDDHPIVRRGLSAEINLDPDMQVAGEARDGIEAVALALSLKPDVVLMDLIMPVMDGIQATREIIAANPDACILVLTSFTEEDNVYAAIKAGASGFIFKDKRPADLLQAIRDMYNGVPILLPSITRRLQRELVRKEQPLIGEESLTEREKEILMLVARGTLYKEIAQELGVREATVRAHVSSILGKLNLSNRSQLVLYAVNHKLIDAGKGSQEL
ncbi:MAG TPA: response regulator transcription factor [Bellilinea sp.]|nr:response regulator transcription factor [Bellilinea sp.]